MAILTLDGFDCIELYTCMAALLLDADAHIALGGFVLLVCAGNSYTLLTKRIDWENAFREE
jgi:inner membrane protein involved in colicin E2 resistance